MSMSVGAKRSLGVRGDKQNLQQRNKGQWFPDLVDVLDLEKRKNVWVNMKRSKIGSAIFEVSVHAQPFILAISSSTWDLLKASPSMSI